jgi:8-oxo-dGTP pyrophosphatase MutT (NUDIX family)
MQKTATVAVINTDKKLLILQRGSTAPWMPHRYCLPGGHKEDNESLIECAARELAEEAQIRLTNINSLIPRTIVYSSSFSKTIFLFQQFTGQVTLNWEHDEYRWVNKEESTKYKIVPGLKIIIQNLYDSKVIT